MSGKEVTIDNKIMGYIALFERTAKIPLKECLENEDMILFIVGEKKMAEMFAKNQNIITQLKEHVNKHILVAELSRDLLSFVQNLFFRFGVREIYITWKQGRIDIQVAVDPMKTGSAIGKEGRNIKLLKEAVSRNFEIGSLSIKQ
ncbi:MAG: NusA-like transcription termination signal-binding factor [Thermoplasmataceae archaeon]